MYSVGRKGERGISIVGGALLIYFLVTIMVQQI